MPNPAATLATHCPYCALQCGMHVARGSGGVTILGNPRFPVNQGGLCVKGWSAAATLDHPDRLRTPLVRDGTGRLVPATWDEALSRIAREFTKIQQNHGRDAIGVFGGGSLTNEKAYLLGKFARVALRTSNIDYNGRFCMSSAAAAAIPGVRPRSRAAVSAVRHFSGRRDPPGRQQRRRDHAAGHAVLRGAAIATAAS